MIQAHLEAVMTKPRVNTGETHPSAQPTNAAVERHRLDQTDMGDLLRRLIHDLRGLVSTELRLAKREVRKDVRGSLLAAGFLAVAGLFAAFGLGLVLLAIFVALGSTPIAAIGMAAAVFAVAAGLGVIGWLELPAAPLDRTEKRLEGEAQTIATAVGS
jgi:uncharacterized membrane protein YqjE